MSATYIKNALSPYIQQWAIGYLNDIIISGSCAKGTAIRGCADVDLFISIASNVPGTLERIYNSLLLFSNNYGWNPRRQNVSIGITYNNTKIDLVPGRVQQGYQNYHSLYKANTGSWTQTNIAEHIRIVRGCGRIDEIIALKVWRELNRLSFPSIYLELTVIEALRYRRTDQLADNIWAVLQYLANDFSTKTVVDPANSNNIISDDLTASEKTAIRNAAGQALRQQNWNAILW